MFSRFFRRGQRAEAVPPFNGYYPTPGGMSDLQAKFAPMLG